MGRSRAWSTLWEDELARCRSDGVRAIVTPVRAIGSWWQATAEEREAMLVALDAGRAHLLTKAPGTALRIGWSDIVDRDPERARLQIELVAHAPIVRGESAAAVALPADTPECVLVRGEDDPLLDHLAACFPRAERVDIAVAFVMQRGVECLLPYFEDLLERRGSLRIVTGDYFGVTEPNALETLLDLGAGSECRVFESNGQSFHPKAYRFDFVGGDGVAFVGSSNMSRAALGDGVEWNYRIVSSRDATGYASLCREFERLFVHEKTLPLSHEWIQAYRRTRRPRAYDRAGVVSEPVVPPDPNDVQKLALAELAATRDQGNQAGLVVLATGLGKTWLGAFDSRGFERVLFVAHREEILDQVSARPSGASCPEVSVRQVHRRRRRHLTSAHVIFASDADAWLATQHLERLLSRPSSTTSSSTSSTTRLRATYRNADRALRTAVPCWGLTATPNAPTGRPAVALCGITTSCSLRPRRRVRPAK